MESKTIKILLIEDSPEDVFLLHAALDRVSGTRFQVEIARNLEAGMEAVTGCRVDLVLLDLTLPDSSGLESFIKLKSRCR